ncbi:type I restriction endonuclease subunit R [Hymenobacter aquaticus]|uniref:Type I restriction enzyme endonuclease subunit n=1 Tax=Hymenobacter aquaticus TaxID=1867101 RepID=A0A4Z0Q2Z2_9BACT|nr:type I restriction endonuclease subunit R [Hymenobacter aquaticus]TGE23954.1 type I restriction endonuclease subunit R [Hymenobacter aquaticus]
MTEDDIEQLALEFLAAQQYQTVYGPTLGPPDSNHGGEERQHYDDVVLAGRLRDFLDRHNRHLPADARQDALRQVLRVGEGLTPLAANEAFHTLLTEGVPVEYRDPASGEVRGDRVWLIDWDRPEQNQFLAVNQLTIIEDGQNKRPDMVLFVNGMPLVVLELKNAANAKATCKQAFQQLQTYKKAIPGLFVYNALLVVSDGFEAKAGTVSSDWSRFSAWKARDEYGLAPTNESQLETLCAGLLPPAHLLDVLRHFLVFEHARNGTIKKLAAYHQFFAVRKAVTATQKAASVRGDKRAGVVWHTQGSGKSLSMVFYAGKLVVSEELGNPTLVILTDRNDLDQQLYQTFTDCRALMRQVPEQAEDREDLRRKLSVAAGGVVFTTIQKFLPEEKGTRYPELSARRNIVVIADEAHRSQYDFIDGFARHLRDALPNATYIGFTGTPVESTDRNTQAVFGDYIDVYDIQQAVEDGATVRIYYENRLVKINLKAGEEDLVDTAFEELTESEELTAKQQLKARWARVEALVGSDDRVRRIAQDIVQHFEARTAVLAGKGMIVCMSRRICAALYAEIVKLRPEWHSANDKQGKLKVVMTGSSSDAEHLQPHIRNKAARTALADRMKDPQDELQLVIVRDMWLTGFDAPSLHTLYVDKPMKGHNLMQAIARVNRVFPGKDGGLVVDYLGIATDLKRALATYTESGGKGKPTLDQAEAVAATLSFHEAVVSLLHGCNYGGYYSLTTKQKLAGIIDLADCVLALPDNGRQRFLDQTLGLLKTFAIAVPHPTVLALSDDVALFQAVRARLLKLEEGSKPAGKSDEEVDTAIRQIVSDAVVAGDVVDIFAEAGLRKPDISILSDEFLAEVRGLKQKNIALELLKKLLVEDIKSRARSNVVQSRKFSEMLDAAVKKYQNNVITAAQIIDELIKLAKDLKEQDARGDKFNLNKDELAFYDALGASESAVEVMGDDKLRIIARELVDIVRKNTSIDWTLKESVQANLRRLVKRILNKYGYPPDLQARAVETVLEQAKRLAVSSNI